MNTNTIQNNTCNLYVEVEDISHYYHSIDSTNTINGKPIYYLVDKSNLLFDDSMSIGFLALVSCQNINVKNLNVSDKRQGLFVINTISSTITNLTICNDSEYGILLYHSSNNTITNCTIYDNPDYGIYLVSSTGNTILGNNFSNNHNGINLMHSSSNTIKDNTITSNQNEGILLSVSRDNDITGNTISYNTRGITLGADNNIITSNNIRSNEQGISLLSASNNKMRHNVMVDNEYNFGIRSYEPADYINDVDESNLVDGKPICYWINKQNAVAPQDAGYVALINCTNIKVENLNLQNNDQGIVLANTHQSTITGNTISNNRYGTFLDQSNSNTIASNNISNTNFSIFLSESKDNTIEGNTLNNNDFGIQLSSSKSNTIATNIISNNGYGIDFICSKFNTIRRNNISNNYEGIWFDSSSFWGFELIDIFFGGSNLNYVVENNFLHNNRDAFFQNSFRNRWKRNYWNKTQLLPKLVLGELYWITLSWPGGIVHHRLPWRPQIDWRPALKPYDIEV
jgi:parallel beta-helix repeat protein